MAKLRRMANEVAGHCQAAQDTARRLSAEAGDVGSLAAIAYCIARQMEVTSDIARRLAEAGEDTR